MSKETDKNCCPGNGSDDQSCCQDLSRPGNNDQELSDLKQSSSGTDTGEESYISSEPGGQEAVDEPDSGDEGEGPDKGDEEIGHLKEQLKLRESQLEDVLSRFQRLQADFENFRKRTQKEKEEMLLTAASSLVEKILPVLDNFQRAVDAVSSDEGSLREGVEMIFKQLEKVLADAGLQRIDCLGTPFDPNLQQAVFRVEDDSLEENTVVEELQKGYLFGGKVIRPAMVKVSCKRGG